MGSIKPTKTKRGYFGKVESSLNEKLETVEWGEFKFNDKLFNLCKVKRKLNKSELDAHGCVPVYSSESTNNGIIGYTNQKPEFLINNENHVYVVFGDHTRSFNIAKSSFCVADNTKVLRIENPRISDKSLMFINSSWKKSIPDKGYSRHWSTAQRVAFKLPTKDGKPDFEFMESFIAELEAERIVELEAYLTAAGLKDYELTPQEQRALDEFEGHKFLCGQFKFKDVFDKVAQGRRLKKDDQIHGDIPFVMSGITNTGVVNYIANPVTVFPKNSITVDIFGNAFYRGYNFGAGDDTGVYWSDKQDYSKEVMLYFAASMNKSLKGKFDYGNKLRSSQSLNIKMHLPIKENELDRSLMTTLISAIQKLVIKDVVLFAERKITDHKQVVLS